MADHSSKTRVVVTGLGAVTPLGIGKDTFWQALLAGQSGITSLTNCDPEGLSTTVAGQVKEFNPGEYMDPKEAKRNDRYTQFAVAASRLAMNDAGAKPGETFDPARFGVIIGSGIGGIESIEKQTTILLERGPRKISPFMIPMIIVNMASGVVAIENQARGPNFCPVSACASGSHAIGEAFRMIREGDVDAMLAGGTEASITRLGLGGFCAMRAMSTQYNDEPTRASRPFDAKRDGFVMGEGSGVILLEKLEHAQARGAHIYAELGGYGSTCDAHHITSPDPTGEGLGNCLRMAIGQAGVGMDEVSYINAHGTSTPLNDKFETLAIKKTFGDQAYKIPVSSTKSMTGHLLGAAGGIEAIVSVMALQDNKLPPTINYENPDPECDLDYITEGARAHQVNVTISNNLGFGGHNASLLFKRA